jgi:hypothetical protein
MSAIVRKHLEEACERAWAEIAAEFGTLALFAHDDPSTRLAQQATRALVGPLANDLSRLAVAALVLPSPSVVTRRRRSSAPRPKLAAIPGGLRRNGHAAEPWRPEDPSTSSL